MSFGPGYQKIETFFNRDRATFKINAAQTRVPEFGAVTQWLVEEKLDGQNIRIHVRGPVEEPMIVTYNGRTDNAQLSGPVRKMMDETTGRVFAASSRPELFFEEFTLYGEAVGPKIQSNPHHLLEPTLVLFDVRIQTFPDGYYWASRELVLEWAKMLGCWTPPVLGTLKLNEIVELVRNGFPVVFNSGMGDARAEGVICRPSHELKTQRGERVIWKLKTKDF